MMPESLFDKLFDDKEQTAGLRFPDGRSWRRVVGRCCPWCAAAPDLGCKEACPLRSASADDVAAAVDAADLIEQMDEDDGQRRRELIRVRARNPRLRERVTDALTDEIYALGIASSAGDARALAATTVLRATGELPTAERSESAAPCFAFAA